MKWEDFSCCYFYVYIKLTTRLQDYNDYVFRWNFRKQKLDFCVDIALILWNPIGGKNFPSQAQAPMQREREEILKSERLDRKYL